MRARSICGAVDKELAYHYGSERVLVSSEEISGIASLSTKLSVQLQRNQGVLRTMALFNALRACCSLSLPIIRTDIMAGQHVCRSLQHSEDRRLTGHIQEPSCPASPVQIAASMS